MRTIWKYPIKLTDNQAVEMPEGAKLLTAQVQNGEVCVWALVNPDAPPVARWIRVAGTGHPLEDAATHGWQYVATVQLDGGALVFHVFEVLSTIDVLMRAMRF